MENMRLAIIATLFVVGLAFCGWRIWGFFDKKRNPPAEVVENESPSPDPNPPADQPGTFRPLKIGPTKGQVVDSLTVVGSYRFKNRLVPEAPAFLRDKSDAGLIVQREETSNSWVWIGGAKLADQISDLAAAYDIKQEEMDLEFVLVLLNTDELNDKGVSLFYSQGANWLDFLSLSGDSASLRLSYGEVALELSYEDTRSGVNVLSQPVIRCVDGEGWRFTADSEVPIPRSEIIDGAIRQSIEYRPVGFGIEGIVRLVGDDILLQVEQRNGSVEPSTVAQVEAPVLSSQTLKSTIRLGWWEWSVLGGIQVDREELRRGLFKRQVKSSSDYLVIFVRPRFALEAPPKAVPVEDRRHSHPLQSGGPGVLPPMPGKPWEREERELIRRKLGPPHR